MAGFDENQPRDEKGQWTAGDASAAIKKAASDADKAFIFGEFPEDAERNAPTMAAYRESFLKRISPYVRDLDQSNFSGLSNSNRNDILRAIEETPWLKEYPLGTIVANEFLKIHNADASYIPTNHALIIEPDQTNDYQYKPPENPEKILDKVNKAKEWASVKERKKLNDFAKSLEEKIKNNQMYVSYNLSRSQKTAEDYRRCLVFHELGHHLHATQKGIYNVGWFKIDKNNVPSHYATTNKQEYLAEWYAKYRMDGEKGVPEDLLKFFKKYH